MPLSLGAAAVVVLALPESEVGAGAEALVSAGGEVVVSVDGVVEVDELGLIIVVEVVEASLLPLVVDAPATLPEFWPEGEVMTCRLTEDTEVEVAGCSKAIQSKLVSTVAAWLI